jgi:hypothetical protein
LAGRSLDRLLKQTNDGTWPAPAAGLGVSFVVE